MSRHFCSLSLYITKTTSLLYTLSPYNISCLKTTVEDFKAKAEDYNSHSQTDTSTLLRTVHIPSSRCRYPLRAVYPPVSLLNHFSRKFLPILFSIALPFAAAARGLPTRDTSLAIDEPITFNSTHSQGDISNSTLEEIGIVSPRVSPTMYFRRLTFLLQQCYHKGWYCDTWALRCCGGYTCCHSRDSMKSQTLHCVPDEEVGDDWTEDWQCVNVE